ncbi:MAG: 1-phosphofructokinase [Rhodospirillales bacterium]|nr:1-phosphofructokinase [Rhodospirillales bacterium]
MAAAPRIVTVSLNAAIDQTASVPNFTAGAVNRVVWEQSDAGGKGVNVASFLAGFGHAVAVTGLLGAGNVELFVRLFDEKNLADRFVCVPGQTRVNVKIVDDVSNRVTDINFPGVAVGPDDLAAVTMAIEDLIEQDAEWFVLSGSLPSGLPPSSYRDLIRLLKSRGRKVVLDTSGAAFVDAIDTGPDVIKPNIDELTELVGRPLEGERAVVDAARDLRRRGIDLVVVSMGAKGAIFVDGAQAVHAAPPPVAVKSTVGAGDAMVAGIVDACLRNLALEDCARLATAFSVGALGEIGPRLPARAVIEDICGQVATKRIEE